VGGNLAELADRIHATRHRRAGCCRRIDRCSLGIVMDCRVDSGKAITFFGHPKPTTLVPARLAIRYGYELVPIHVERLGPARFRVSFHPPVAVPEGEDELQQAVLMTEHLHRLFESWIRACPGSWFASKRMWPKETYSSDGPTAA
jgi:KDO2-lipid IV(A) lauroyltransferase